MTCPYRGQGPVRRAVFRPNGESIRVCEERNAVWIKTKSITKITNYTPYTEKLGLAPLWDQLELLSVVKDEEEDL